MITQKIGNDTLCFFADTQKELSITFFRIQEYYESRKVELFRKNFDFFTFLDVQMDKKGEIDYFSTWDGFNIPSHIFKKWFNSTSKSKRSKYEEALIDEIYKNIDTTKPFYIIGVRKNAKDVLLHELSHALYYLNKDFKTEADSLVESFQKTSPRQYKKFANELRKLGYSDEVLQDEIIAWLATTRKSEFENSFTTKYAEIEKTIKLFRGLLRKHNKHV